MRISIDLTDFTPRLTDEIHLGIGFQFDQRPAIVVKSSTGIFSTNSSTDHP
jgi:hypothetical protein